MQLLQLAYALRLQVEPASQLLVGAGGDVLVYEAMHLESLGNHSYRGLWDEAEAVMQEADVFYLNLEGTITSRVNSTLQRVNASLNFTYGSVYQSWRNSKNQVRPDPTSVPSSSSGVTLTPRGLATNAYNYHPQIGRDLRESGVDVVSVAQNHALDRGVQGFQDTVSNLESSGIRAAADVTHVQAKGWKTAWLACTEKINLDGHGSRSIPTSAKQTKEDYTPRNIPDAVAAGVHGCDEDFFFDAISKASQENHAVIAAMHMDGGVQYEATDAEEDKAILQARARRALEAGAVLVLVSGSHVIRSGWEVITTQDGRQTVAMYSLGNFLSNVGMEVQSDHPRDFLHDIVRKNSTEHLNAGVLWFSGLVHPTRAEVACVSYVPICWALAANYGHHGNSTHVSLNCDDNELQYLDSVLSPAHAAARPECKPIGKFDLA